MQTDSKQSFRLRLYDGRQREAQSGMTVAAGRVGELLSAPEPNGLPHGDWPEGAIILPAPGDAHVHLAALGRMRGELNRRDLNLKGLDYEDLLAAVRGAAARLPPGEWLTGFGWDHTRWQPSAALTADGWPSAAALEAAAPGRPVSLRRIDGHAAWVNETALSLTGIGAASVDPPGGSILRLPSGAPLGILVDEAMTPVSRLLPKRVAAGIEADLRAGLSRLLAAGVLEVHDMDIDDETAAAHLALQRGGPTPQRIVAYAGAESRLAEELLERGPQRHGDSLLFAGLKLYADGALGSRGAALLCPYHDAPETAGLHLWEDARLGELFARAARAGLQIAAHAIGDAACRQLLDQFEKLHDDTQGAPGRLNWRIEHAQTIAAEDLPRFARLGITASVQPAHAVSDAPWAAARLGADRLSGAYAYRALLDSGAKMAGGSDAPIDDERPLFGLYAACTRQDAAGRPPGGFLPAQKLDPHAAWKLFSAGVMQAGGRTETGVGTLAPGQPADFIVVDRDVIAAPHTAATASVLAVYRAGTQIFTLARPEEEKRISQDLQD